MAERTMNTIMHAAFRRDLARFDHALEVFPGGARPRADQLHVAWTNYAYQLHHHHQDEESIFWPAFRELGADEALVGDLDGEHARMVTALDGATAAMQVFHADPSTDSAQEARAAITELSKVLHEHLEHEERDLEPFAVRHAKAPELKAAKRAVRKAYAGHTGTFMAWLQDGTDPDTLTALRHEVPPPVLYVLTKFGGRRYQREIAPTWS